VIRLKAHNKTVGKLNKIDKLILVPKKYWEDFPAGESEYRLNHEKLKLRVYDIPCDCSGPNHTHRIVDLRDIWDELNLIDGSDLEIER